MLLWDTFFDAGAAQLKNGKYGKAEQLLKSALGEASSFPADDPRLLQTLLALVSVYQRNNRPKEAVPHLKKAEELILPPTGLPPESQAEVIRAQLFQLSFGDPDPKAEADLRERLVQVWQSGGSAYADRLLESLLELAGSERESQGEEAARKQLERALSVAEERDGLESEGVTEILELLIQSDIASQSYAEAEELGRRKLSIQSKLYGEDDARLAPTLATLSEVVERQRRMGEALPLIERASGLPGERKTHYYLSYVEALLRSGAPADGLAKLITLEKVNVQGALAGRYELLLLRAYQGVEDWRALQEQAESICADPESTPLARIEALLVRCELHESKTENRIGPLLDQIVELDCEELDGEGSLLARIANLSRSIGRRDLSESFYDRAIRARTKDLDLNDPQSVKVLYELGTIQERRRLLPDAVTSWEKSLEYLRRHAGAVDGAAEERRMRIDLVERLADIYIRQRRWERAEQAWRSLVRSSPPTSLEHIKGRLGLTTVYTGQGEHQKAYDYLAGLDTNLFEEAQCGRFLSDTAYLLEITNLLELNKVDEAAKKRDLRLGRRNGIENASVSELLASCLVARKARMEERLAADGRELVRRKVKGAAEQQVMARFYALLAENNSRYYPPEPKPLDLTSLQAYEKAIHWAVEANGEVDITVAELYEEAAKAAVAESAWDEAESSTKKSLELFEMIKGSRSAELLSPLQRLGELHLGKGQLDEAIVSLERAFGLAGSHLKPQDIQVRELLRSLVEAHRRRGEFEQSRRHLKQLLGLYQRYEELGVEGKLDDLLRGIRLLLGDSGDHRETLAAYLDEATDLALARGPVAELSLAFCLGQKARLVGPRDPDLAISLLQQQSTTLENREEASEFSADQLLLTRMLLYRGHPGSALALLDQIRQRGPLRKPEWARESQILEAQALFAIRRLDTMEQLDELVKLAEQEQAKGSYFKAEVWALHLNLYHLGSELVSEEKAALAYGELDQLLEDGEWESLRGQHEMRERRGWELARFSFETRKLSPEAAVKRLLEHIEGLRESLTHYPGPLADALVYLAGLQEGREDPQGALRALKEARTIYEASGDAGGLTWAQAVAEVARLAEILENTEQAVEATTVALAGLETHLGADHPSLIPLLLGLGRVGRKIGDQEAAEQALTRADGAIAESKSTLPLALRSDVLRELAALYSAQGRVQQARLSWLRLRDMWEDSGELLPTGWMEEFGMALVADGAFSEALQFFLDTLPLRLDHGDDSLLLSLYARWLEMTLHCEPKEQAKESAEHLWEVRDVIHSVLGEEPQEPYEKLWARILVGFTQLHLAGLYDGSESIKEDLETALKLREKHLGPESTQVGEVLALRAELAIREKELSTAENCLTRALNIVESNLGPDTWEVAEILLQLANVYFRKNRFSPTEAVLQRTLELCRTLLGENDPRWIEVCHLRGKLSLELGRPSEAFRSLDRAMSLSEANNKEPGRSLLVAAGRSCLATDRDDRALTLFLRAEEYFPEEPAAWDEETEEVKLALGELLVERESFEEADERLAKVLVQQEKRYGYGDPKLGRIYRALGRAASGLGRLDEAAERLDVALALQEEELFTPLDLFGPFYRLAYLYREQGDEERATAILEENLERARSSGRHEKIAQMSQLLAESQERRGDLERAERAWRETIENLESALEVEAVEHHPRLQQKLLQPLESLATLFTSGRRYTAAEELTKRRLALTESLSPAELELASVLFSLAELYRCQELYREAEEMHQKVLAIRAGEYGRNHPEVARSLRALGQIALGQKDPESARQSLQKAFEVQAQELGQDHSELAETLFSLGDLALLEEDFAQAEEHYRRALTILEGSYGEDSFRTAKAWTALAQLYQRKQQWSRAQPLLGRAMESVEAVLGPSHLEVADLLERTAQVYLVSGAMDQVADPLERALQIRQDHLGDDHPATARVLKLQGDYNALLGDLKAARRLYSKADTIIADFHGVDSHQRFPFRFVFASTLRKLGEYEQSESHLQVMMERLQGEDQESLLKRADLKEELAYLKLAQGSIPEAESAIKEALDTRSKILSSNSMEVSSAFEALARIHHADRRFVTASALAERALDALSDEEEELERPAGAVVSRARIESLLSRIELDQASAGTAIEHANTALGLLRELLGDHHPEVAEVLHLLGEIALSERKLEKAESYFEDALKRWESFFGGSHRQVCRAVSSLATLYQQQGRLTLAEEFHQRNLGALEGRYGADSPIVVETLIGLGKLCRSQGNTTDAEAYLKRAAEIQGGTKAGIGMKMADILHTLALVYQDERNYIASEALFKKARDIRQMFADEDSPEIAESNLALARLYRTSGKSAEAEPLLRSVLDWRSERLGEDHPEVASLLREMAELYADQKEYIKAQTLVKKALGIYGEALGHRNLELVGPLRQLARLLEASGDSEEAEKQRRLAEELMGAG